MKRFALAIAIAVSALTGLAAAASADYFGNDTRTQQGQLLTGPFDKIEKGGI